MTLNLDAFDIKIVNLMQEDSHRTTEEIAQKVGLSASSVQRRLRRLRAGKAIKAEVAVISPELVGRPLTAIVGVTLEPKTFPGA